VNEKFFKNFCEWRGTKRQNGYFGSKVEVPRIKVGKRQILETLINEEALLFAKYLRHERQTWNPRIVVL
jgi:hypothetical protein